MTFDSTLYETLPQTNVAATLALVRASLTSSKGLTHPAAKKALRRLRTAGESLRGLHEAAPPAKTVSVTKAADTAMDRIWNAVQQRLEACLELGGDDAAEAARVHSLLFPKGMLFLAFRYAEQWAEGEAILRRIGSEKLEPSLEKLVGASFLQVLRERHLAYGDALGITKAKVPDADSTSLVEPLREARRALSTYMRIVAAAVDNGDIEERDGSAALAPITHLRQTMRSSKRGVAPEPAIPPIETEPLPSVE
jgi:hypothetical protein